MDKVTRDFLRQLKKSFNVQKVILFGSRAGKDYLATSDYDFIIVSSDFQKQPFLGRAAELIRKCKAYFAADFLCYTPEEFEIKKKQIGTVSNALKYGIELV